MAAASVAPARRPPAARGPLPVGVRARRTPFVPQRRRDRRWAAAWRDRAPAPSYASAGGPRRGGYAAAVAKGGACECALGGLHGRLAGYAK